MNISIKDVAKKLDLSIATVSKALNGKGTVKKETSERVIREAKRLDILLIVGLVSLLKRRLER